MQYLTPLMENLNSLLYGGGGNSCSNGYGDKNSCSTLGDGNAGCSYVGGPGHSCHNTGSGSSVGNNGCSDKGIG